MSEKDPRHTLTIKGEQFTPEFRRRINAAAKREGLTQAEWIYLVLSRASGGEMEADHMNSTEPAPQNDTNSFSRLLARRSGIALKAVLQQEDIHDAIAMFLGSNGFDASPDDVAIFHTAIDGRVVFSAEAREVRIIDL